MQKKNRQNDLFEILGNFSCIIKYADSTFMGQSTPTTAFDELIQYLHKTCMKEFDAKKKDSFTKGQLLELRQTLFRYKL